MGNNNEDKKQPLRHAGGPAIDILPGADHAEVSDNVFTGYENVARVAGKGFKFQRNEVTSPVVTELTRGLAAIVGTREAITIEEALRVVERYNRPGAPLTRPEVLAQESGVDRWLGRGANVAAILERIQTWATSPVIVAAFQSLLR